MRPPKRTAPRMSSRILARWLRVSCDTRPTCFSATCGYVLPWRRSLATVSALIASGQVAQITYHLNRAMDNGLTKSQASEVLTQLAFYAGWPNVFSALPVAKAVFEKRPD